VSRRMHVRRTMELNALTGWKANLSTAMELGDVIAPLLMKVIDRVSRFVSWLLVTLVGGGLGLIYRGVRQSMRGASGMNIEDVGRSKRYKKENERRDSSEDSGFFYGFA
jgi:hypothetical protein